MSELWHRNVKSHHPDPSMIKHDLNHDVSGEDLGPAWGMGEKMIQTIYPKLRKQLQGNPHVEGAIILPAGLDSSSVPEPVDLILLVFHEKVNGRSVLSYMTEIWKVKELRIPLQGLTAEVIAGNGKM